MSLLLLTLLAPMAEAQELRTLASTPLGADAPFEHQNEFFGEARLRLDGLTDPTVDTLGTPSDRSAWATSRLRFGFQVENERSAGVLEIEALSGRWAGGTPLGQSYSNDIFAVNRTGGSADLSTVLPRQAWYGMKRPGGIARVGAQTFTWGTGMLANDGAGDPVFGDAVRGSVVNRLMGALTPWKGDLERGALMGVGFLAAVDLVLRDENATLMEGDIATQGVLGVRSEFPRWQAGVLAVARWQQDRFDPNHPLSRPRTTAFPVDAHARIQLNDTAAPTTVGIEAEAVMVRGRTERSWTDEALDGARLQSAAAIGRVRLDNQPARLTAMLESGAASGDNDLRDDVVRTFTMHSDHNVGLVLFDELLPMLSARSIDRASDPGLSAVPAASGRFAVAQGGVHNAVYLYPTVRWRLTEPLEARLGYLHAWSAGDVIDVYQSAANGGYNTTYGGVSGGSHHLGQEALAGARWRIHAGPTQLELGLEGALFLPGSAFDGLDLGLLTTGRARADLRW